MRRTSMSMPTVRLRTVILVTLLVLLSSQLPPVGQSAHAQPVLGNAPTYLALGDSYPFGSWCVDGTCIVAPEDEAVLEAKNDNWFVGYPVYLQELIDRPLVNAGCPGEVTESFLQYPHPTRGRRCQMVKEGGLLHVDYSRYAELYSEPRGTLISQMEFATRYLTTHFDRVQLITLQLGGPETNAQLFGPCRLKFPPPDSAGFQACVLGALPNFIEGVIGRLETILAGIRDTGYAGPLIYVEYPATNFNTFQAGIQPIMYDAVGPIVLLYGGEMAPVWEEFRNATLGYAGNSCAAGLLLTNDQGLCDIHPTTAGHQLIASIIYDMLNDQ